MKAVRKFSKDFALYVETLDLTYNEMLEVVKLSFIEEHKTDKFDARSLNNTPENFRKTKKTK